MVTAERSDTACVDSSGSRAGRRLFRSSEDGDGADDDDDEVDEPEDSIEHCGDEAPFALRPRAAPADAAGVRVYKTRVRVRSQTCCTE